LVLYLLTLLSIPFLNYMTIPAETSVSHQAPQTAYIRTEWLINQFARITQFCTWPIAFVVFNIFLRLDVKGREHLGSVRSPFIVVSNHISFYDSFLFRLILGFSTPHLPLRFMAVKKFNSPIVNTLSAIGFIDLVYALFGVFTVVPKKGIEENLKKAVHIVQCGGNVVVYPEGSIVTGGGVGPFKNGAALLAQKTAALVLPLSFRYGNRKFFRRDFVVNIAPAHAVPRDVPCSDVSQSLWVEVRTLFDSSLSS
jgi:1-acyl-sn-glycerol-3-phosphate acyltransferase